MNVVSNVQLNKVVVTGGLGFIGSALCRRLLADGSRVLVVDNHLFGRRRQVLRPHRNLTVKNIDIRDRTALVRAVRAFRPDTLFHLAAIAFIPKCSEDPASAVAVHLDGTLNVLLAAKLAHVKHVHFASSADVYSPAHVVLSEKRTPLLPPPDVYGPTKLAGELLFRDFHESTGTHTVITRGFNVYGQNRTNRFLVPSVCEQINEGARTLHLGNLKAARDYVHVDDFVDALLLLMKKTRGLVTVNVGTGKKTTIRTIVKLCEAIVGRKIRIVSSARNRRPSATDRPAWQADMTHAGKLIGWKPTVTLKMGLERLIDRPQR